MITPKQNALYQYIKASLQESPVSPSYQDMQDHLGVKSKHTIHVLVKALEERGLIVRLRGKARSIRLAGGDMTSAAESALMGIDKVARELRQGGINRAVAARRIEELVRLGLAVPARQDHQRLKRREEWTCPDQSRNG